MPFDPSSIDILTLHLPPSNLRTAKSQLAASHANRQITYKIPLEFGPPPSTAEAAGSFVLAGVGLAIVGSSFYFLIGNLMAPEDKKVYARSAYRPENQPGSRGSSSYPSRY